MTENELIMLVNSTLSFKRAEHTIAVAKLSVELAQKNDVSVADAYLAAMLHDITKEVPFDEQLQTLASSDIISPLSIACGKNIFHAVTAFLKARDEFKVTNSDVLNAIKYHTTGRANMSVLEKIVFTADAVSYDRTYDEAKRLRELALADLDSAMLCVVSFVVKDLISKQKPIFPDTIECYNSCVLLKQKEKSNENK